METSRYDEIKLQADTIRHELGRVVAARAMNLLVGANTFANLKENPKHAFRLLSQAYGLIYASQFARNVQGQPFITYEETRKLLQTLEQEGGLWDKDRLLGEEKDEAFVMGGQSIYEQLLPYCDVVHVTRIDQAYEADTYFPDLDQKPEWKITAESDEQTYFDLEYTFVRYEKKKSQ